MGGLSSGSADGYVDTELCLRTGGSICSSPTSFSSPSTQQHQPLTIFYAGAVCTCSVTPLQAGAIMAAAEGEAQVIVDTPRGTSSCLGEEEVTTGAAAETAVHGKCPRRPDVDLLALSPTKHSPATPQAQLLLDAGLSMRRSLQRFLQKRNTRAAHDASPYARPGSHFHALSDAGSRCRQKRNQPALSLSLS